MALKKLSFAGEESVNVESSLKYERSKYAFVYDKEPRNIQYRH